MTLQCNVPERVNSAAETQKYSQPDIQQLRPSQHSATVAICGEGTEEVLSLQTVT